MTTFEEYLASIETLSKAIAAIDHGAVRSQSASTEAVEQFDRDLAAKITLVQQQAARESNSYSAATHRLEGRIVAQSGVRLPARVRAATTTTALNDAVQKQNRAITALERSIADFESAVANIERGDASPAAEPPPPSVGETKQSRLKPLNGLVSLWLVVAVPLVIIGAWASGSEFVLTGWVGGAAGLAIGFTVAFYLVGFKGVTLPAIRARIERNASIRTPVALIKTLVSSKSRIVPPKGIATVIDRATEAGFMSGFEPSALKDTPIPSSQLMYGKPGSGLVRSGFAADAVKMGQRGEENFAKALAKTDLINRFATFWSIHMLSKDTYGKEQSDVDCAIITGQTIWLVDLKYYPGGNVEYRTSSDGQLICVNLPTGQQVGKSKKMSRNMQMAIERFRSRYKNYGSLSLQARVVFVPTNSGVGRIDSVKWPGDIPAVMLPDFLAELEREAPFVQTLDSDLVLRTFKGLLKA